VAVHVTVKLYSYLREYAQNPDGTVCTESPQGSSVRDVVHSIGLTGDDVFLILINKHKADLKDTVQDGDFVEVFPIVGGG
jgi:molybdopterin converting factor small subunit